MGAWAADVAEHVLPFFEKEFLCDKRPRMAIKVLRAWVKSGVFHMAVIRKASLDAHAAAREAEEGSAARFAARAAGQAVATAHVPEHAFGSAYYALKTVAAANPDNAEVKIAKELDWQTRHLPENLRKRWLDFRLLRFPKQLKPAIASI